MARGIYMFIASECKPLKCTSAMGAIHTGNISVDMKLSNISAQQQIAVSHAQNPIYCGQENHINIHTKYVVFEELRKVLNGFTS